MKTAKLYKTSHTPKLFEVRDHAHFYGQAKTGKQAWINYRILIRFAKIRKLTFRTI